MTAPRLNSLERVTATNPRIASLLDQMADLLEIQAANPFRIRAYRNAARMVRDWPRALAAIVSEDEAGAAPFPKIPGVGPDLAGKIREIVKTNTFSDLEALKRRVPEGLVELMELPGLGPRRAALLHQKLRLRSVDDLERAVRSGAVARIRGFGPKLVAGFLEALERRRGQSARRLPLGLAEVIAEPMVRRLGAVSGVTAVEAAGSLRRRKETVGDIDILVACRKEATSRVLDAFTSIEGVAEVLARGLTRCTVLLEGGLHADLRIVRPASFGSALHYFTGSKSHNIAVRALGVRGGLKINEYGIYRGHRRVGGAEENEVFASVGLPYIEPELREGEGEIEAARQGRLPRLVTIGDLRGDLHAHTRETDGRATLREMVGAAIERGYEYLAITDHSRRLAMAHGLDPRRLGLQMRKIDRLNEEFAPFRILKGCEVDILEDGRLDLPDAILSELDLTVCSVHSHFDLSPERQLERVLRAMDNPNLTILGHPTGRRMSATRARPPMELDIERVLAGARDRGVFVELNSQPERLDLKDHDARLARSMGVLLALSTDAHSVRELDFIRLGISQARRAWLEARDLLNTRPITELLELLGRRKKKGSGSVPAPRREAA